MNIHKRIGKDEGRSKMYREELVGYFREDCVTRLMKTIENQLRECVVQDDSILSSSLKYSDAIEEADRELRKTRQLVREIKDSMSPGDVTELYRRVMSQ